MIFIVALSFFAGIYRYSIIDKGSRVLVFLLGSELINEIIARYCAVKYHSNLAVYNIYDIIELFILALYFNAVIDVFTKKNIGIYIGVVGAVLCILNIIFVQSLNTVNSYSIFLEGFCIISMSLYAFFRMLIQSDRVELRYYNHFWFITILLLYFSMQYINWGSYGFLSLKIPKDIWIVDRFIWAISCISYLMIGVVLFISPKWKINDR